MNRPVPGLEPVLVQERVVVAAVVVAVPPEQW